MKDKILRALDLCIDWKDGDCAKCPYCGVEDSCYKPLFKDVLAVINEQDKAIDEAYEQAKKDIIELITNGI